MYVYQYCAIREAYMIIIAHISYVSAPTTCALSARICAHYLRALSALLARFFCATLCAFMRAISVRISAHERFEPTLAIDMSSNLHSPVLPFLDP